MVYSFLVIVNMWPSCGRCPRAVFSARTNNKYSRMQACFTPLNRITRWKQKRMSCPKSLQWIHSHRGLCDHTRHRTLVFLFRKTLASSEVIVKAVLEHFCNYIQQGAVVVHTNYPVHSELIVRSPHRNVSESQQIFQDIVIRISCFNNTF